MTQTTLKDLATILGIQKTREFFQSEEGTENMPEVSFATYGPEGESTEWVTLWNGTITIGQDLKTAKIIGQIGPNSRGEIVARIDASDWSQIRLTSH